MKKIIYLWIILAIATGLAIALIDSQPTWDDTGVTVFMILMSAMLYGFLAFEKPWLFALAVSIWVPLLENMTANNYGALFAFVPGFAGAYAGYYIKHLISKK